MARTDGGSGMGPSRRRTFVGRVRELNELVETLDEAIAGRGSISLVTGEPGIGKTSLLSEVAELASQRGARVAWGRCWEGHVPAYQPWLDVLRSCVGTMDGEALKTRIGEGASYLAHIVPELLAPSGIDPRPVESDLARFRLFDAIWQVLVASAEESPIVLIFDDLHWSDVASVRLLEFVSRNLMDAPVLVLGAYREVDARQRVELGEVLAAVARHGASLPLRGLSEDEIGLFVTERLDAEIPADIRPRLHALTGGNPFFVDELVRLLVAEARIDPDGSLPIPDGVRETIRRRSAPLSDEALDVLRLASVVGRTFLASVVAASSARRDEAVRSALWDACRLELVDETGPAIGRYAFSHELVRETLYDDIPPMARMRLHLQVGEALERLQPRGADPAEVAGHFFRAAETADRHETLEHVRRAGDAAMTRLAYEDAGMWFDRALAIDELIDDGNDARRFDLLCALGEANRCAAQFGPSMDAYAKAVALAHDLDDRAGCLTRAALGFEDVRMASLNLWQLPASMLHLRAALDAVGHEDPVRRAQLCSRLAQVTLFLAPADAPAIAREALEIADGANDPSLRAVALEGLRWAIWHPSMLSERLAVSSDWLATAQLANDDEAALRARILLAVDFLESGEMGAVAAQVAAFEREAAGLHQAWFNWWPAAFRATRSLMAGAFTDAEAHLADVRAAGSAFDSLAPIASSLADAYVAWERHDPSAVEVAVERFVPLVPLPGFREAGSLFERTAHGDLDGARACVERFMAVFPQIVDTFMRPSIVAVVCPGVAFAGDREAAESLYEVIAPYERRPLLLAPLPCFQSASHWLGVLAATAGRTDDATRHFEDAVALAERLGAPAWVARSRLEYGRLLLQTDAERGREMLNEALEAAERMGLKAVAHQARGWLGDVVDRALPPSAACVFRCDGDVWTLTFNETSAQLRDTKGLRYIRELLAHPGDEMHVLRLVTTIDANGGNGSSSQRRAATEAGLSLDGARGDDALDEEARTAYGARIDELRDDIDEARSFGDDERAARASIELDTLTDELTRSFGLGGRAREMGSPAERARVNVTRSITRAIDRISEVHPALGNHLGTLVRTGAFCVYATDPTQPVRWST